MKKINHKQLYLYISENVMKPFYDLRLEKLKSVKLTEIIKRKNPYLFKAKNIDTSGDLAKAMLDAFLSSQEETIFGNYVEKLAIHVCATVFGGKKAEQGKLKSIDLIFERDSKVYLVSIKSGPAWGNSDQINQMKRNFKSASENLRAKYKKNKIIAVNGCIYGRDNKPFKEDQLDREASYFKFCGQKFWELISGDSQLYKKIIQPLDQEAKRRDQVFKETYAAKVNEMTKSIVELFYKKNNLNWEKIVDYISKEEPSRYSS